MYSALLPAGVTVVNLPVKDDPELSLREHYSAAGAVLSVETNSGLILAAARETFAPLPGPAAADASIRLWVSPDARGAPPWPRPHFRGLDHVVFAAFDSENTALIDRRQKRAIVRLSPAMAADRDYLWRAVFPSLFGIFTDTIPVTALHFACVERAGRGLLLTGPSGCGKSTLSLSLARSGFGFLSDEWTYFSPRDGRLEAHGLSAPLKLLPDAVEHFPELARIEPTVSLNGEIAYEVRPEDVFGIRRVLCAEPDCVILLERQDGAGFDIRSTSPTEVTADFKHDEKFLASHRFEEAGQLLVKTLEALGRIRCWKLRYGGRPEDVARALSQFLDTQTHRENGDANDKLKDEPVLKDRTHAT